MFAWRGLSKLRKMRDELLFANVERRLEAGVQGNLVAGDQFVGFVGNADHRLQLLEHFRGHAFGEGGSGVGINAVLAIVGDAHGDLQKCLGERIDGSAERSNTDFGRNVEGGRIHLQLPVVGEILLELKIELAGTCAVASPSERVRCASR